ncbi:MAG: flagellar basal body rod protein FlgC [Lautropia sp.]|nr:flagellar basal body rod protein FlgC [Lautropia sp.]
MPSLMNILPLAGSALSAQSQRLNTVASNLANADTVAGPDGQVYKSRQVVFKPMVISDRHELSSMSSVAAGHRGSVGVRVVNVVEDQAPGKQTYDPKNPAADESGYVTHSNVNVVEEMVNMISASRSYQNNVEMMNTAQQLALKTLSIGQ